MITHVAWCVMEKKVKIGFMTGTKDKDFATYTWRYSGYGWDGDNMAGLSLEGCRRRPIRCASHRLMHMNRCTAQSRSQTKSCKIVGARVKPGIGTAEIKGDNRGVRLASTKQIADGNRVTSPGKPNQFNVSQHS